MTEKIKTDYYCSHCNSENYTERKQTSMKYLVRVIDNYRDDLVDKFTVDAESIEQAKLLAEQKFRDKKYHHSIVKHVCSLEIKLHTLHT